MLAGDVCSYLELRRACGFKLKSEGTLLKDFAEYSSARGNRHVCRDVAIEWAGSAASIHQRARRLGTVIRFARHVRAEDSLHEIPPAIFGSEKGPRPVPYILSEGQIRELIRAASQAGYRTLRRQTYATFFSLLACTGLRVSEAIHLRFDDVTSDGLLIRGSKFRKSRIVPLHDTARAGLKRYLQQRQPYAPLDDHVFISLRRRALLIEDVGAAFRAAAEMIGLRRGPGVPHPTPHSLRHTFAVTALKTCVGGRDEITKHMLALSTYLGHARVADTYWYLEATPELMRGIANHCENFMARDRD